MSETQAKVFYTRETGPVCWEAVVFPAPADPAAALARELRESGLAWQWESARPHPEQETTDASLPAVRPLTPLDEASEGELLRDLAETDQDDYRRFVALFATDDPLPPEGLRAALEAFCRREEGPLRAVVVQVGDSPAEHVFVPHRPAPEVSALLDRWGLTAGPPPPERPYRRLWTASLESLYGLDG